MLILGIETSCDETSASLVRVENEKIEVISNIVSSQIEKHAPFGGVVPSLAAREHVKNLGPVIKSALKTNGYKLETIDLIAVTSGPGLISSLLVGTAFAKTLAWRYKKPIIGINHIEGHIYSNWLKSKNTDNGLLTIDHKLFPALCLVVSGGHTQLILMTDYGKYKLIGETVDDAAGEAFDKIARILELGYPGGPAVAATAAKLKMKNEKLKIELPRPMIHSSNYNFSFAGLKTAVLYLVREMTKKIPLEKIRSEIAFEAQEAIVDVLVTKTAKAAKEYEVKSIMLAGGVSANKKLREKLSSEAEKIGIPFFKPEMEYTGDNAAMIALTGYMKVKNEKIKTESYRWEKITANANWEIV